LNYRNTWKCKCKINTIKKIKVLCW
jgi:hypothetical protein